MPRGAKLPGVTNAVPSNEQGSEFGTMATGTTRANVARTMITSLLRAALPPLVAVVTLPIILGRVSLTDYGLWATITGLIAVLATIDQGLATATTRSIAAARGENDHGEVVQATRHGMAMALGLALVVMPLAGLAGWPIVHWIAPETDFTTAIWLWWGVIIYQTLGWFYAMQAAVATGLQRGDMANSVNALGALVGALVTVVCVIAGAGVFGLLYGMWALGVVTLIGHMYTARKLTGTAAVWLPALPSHPRRLLMTAAALASLQASLMIEPAAAKAILSAFDGPESAAAMQLGFTVTRLALIAAMAPTAAILVGVSEWRTTQPERIGGLVRTATYASLALVAVMATVMLAAGPYVAQAWLGLSVPGIGVAVRGLSVVAVTTIVVWLFTQSLLGHGNTKTVAWRLLTGTAVALAGMAATAVPFGLAGVIAASLLGTVVAAVLLGRVDREYAAIIWPAVFRIGPAMLLTGVIGAVLIDYWQPPGRLAAALAAGIAAIVALIIVWILLPADTRGVMVRTLKDRLR